MIKFRKISVVPAFFALVLLQGCATGNEHGLPGNWQVEYIEGRGVIDNSPAQIVFHLDGRISGNASCNTFSGTYSINGDSLALGQLALTRRACVAALMEQEARFLAVLERVAGWEVEEPECRLLLLGGQEETLLGASCSAVGD